MKEADNKNNLSNDNYELIVLEFWGYFRKVHFLNCSCKKAIKWVRNFMPLGYNLGKKNY